MILFQLNLQKLNLDKIYMDNIKNILKNQDTNYITGFLVALLSVLISHKYVHVPTIFSKKVLKIFTKAKKKFILIKKGDHSLSDKKSLKKIINELNVMIDMV